VETEVVEHIFDFVYIILRNEQKFGRQCLRTFNVIAKVESDMVRSIADDLVPFATVLIDSPDPIDFSSAAKCLRCLLELEKDAVAKVVTERLPLFIGIAESHEVPEMRGRAGILLSTACECLDLDCSRCLSIIDSFLGQENLVLVKSAARMSRYLVSHT
jgi:hypothetical protein